MLVLKEVEVGAGVARANAREELVSVVAVVIAGGGVDVDDESTREKDAGLSTVLPPKLPLLLPLLPLLLSILLLPKPQKLLLLPLTLSIPPKPLLLPPRLLRVSLLPLPPKSPKPNAKLFLASVRGGVAVFAVDFAGVTSIFDSSSCWFFAVGVESPTPFMGAPSPLSSLEDTVTSKPDVVTELALGALKPLDTVSDCEDGGPIIYGIADTSMVG